MDRKDWPVAVTEDALAGGGALLAALASLSPARSGVGDVTWTRPAGDAPRLVQAGVHAPL